MKRICRPLAMAAGVTLVVCGVSPAWAQVAPSLGSAQSFAVLGGSTVTNTGSSIVTGDVGVSPGSAVTGFPPGLVVSGTIHAADAVALSAQNSAVTAYNALAAQACTADLTGQDLGGLTLTPGVYCFSSTAFLTGTLTLNAQGNPAAVFIFRVGTALTTASGSIVSVINGGSTCNVFWQIATSATLGTTSSFGGNILALASITLTTGANLSGRALARSGAVTLDGNNVSAAACFNQGCPAINFAPPTLPNGTEGVPYSQTLTGSGGTPPYTFSVVAGALPNGLTLSPGGVISGTPTLAMSYAFTIRGVDANGCFIDRPFAVTIFAPVPTLPQIFVVLLAVGLGVLGYLRLRRRARAQ
jgi:hypothetical protein